MEDSILPHRKDVETDHCRFCAKNKSYKNLINIFDNGKRDRILSLINYFNMNYVDICRNSFYKMICDACYNFLNEAYVFFEQVKQAQSDLMDIIYNIKTESTQIQIKIEKYDSDQKLNCPETNVPIYEMEHSSGNKTVLEHVNYRETQEDIIGETTKKINNENNLNLNHKNKKINDKVETIQNMVKLSVDNWTNYPWTCKHCKMKCKTIEELRLHSKETHKMCYGYHCVDCNMMCNQFNVFISHVRNHRRNLRHYCPYCNQKFTTPSQCEDHTKSHEVNKAICNLCCEVFPDTRSLYLHKTLYNKVPIKRMRQPLRMVDVGLREDGSDFTWNDYRWICNVCSKNFPDVATLRQHGNEIHETCFAMKCVDCSTRPKSFVKFINHVQKHRPYLKKYCAYCNEKIDDADQLATHINTHFNGPQKPCYGCGQIFINNELRKQHMKIFMAPRPANEIDPEDLVCNICQKQCQTLFALKLHKQTHSANRIRNFTCDTCGKAFFNMSTLKGHITLHKEKTHICKICQQSFHAKYHLKSHVQSHLQFNQVECDYCGKTYNNKPLLVAHIKTHLNYRPYKCNVCGKLFRRSQNLRTHSHTHTGCRPYSCALCGKGFTNWGNWNKHMISNHGVALNKKKAVSKENLDTLDKRTKEWVDALIKNKTADI